MQFLKKVSVQIQLLFWSLFIPTQVYAQTSGTSLGGAAGNVLVPMTFIANTFYNICFVLGISFIIGAGVRYKEHRDNPTQAPISGPVALLIFGLIFIAIPIIAKLSESSHAISS